METYLKRITEENEPVLTFLSILQLFYMAMQMTNTNVDIYQRNRNNKNKEKTTKTNKKKKIRSDIRSIETRTTEHSRTSLQWYVRIHLLFCALSSKYQACHMFGNLLPECEVI